MPPTELTIDAAPAKPAPVIPFGFRSCAHREPKRDIPVIVRTASGAIVVATYGRVDVPGFPFVQASGYTIAGGAPVEAVAWKPIPKAWLK
jgi:hypothetical protein